MYAHLRCFWTDGVLESILKVEEYLEFDLGDHSTYDFLIDRSEAWKSSRYSSPGGRTSDLAKAIDERFAPGEAFKVYVTSKGFSFSEPV